SPPAIALAQQRTPGRIAEERGGQDVGHPVEVGRRRGPRRDRRRMAVGGHLAAMIPVVPVAKKSERVPHSYLRDFRQPLGRGVQYEYEYHHDRRTAGVGGVLWRVDWP